MSDTTTTDHTFHMDEVDTYEGPAWQAVCETCDWCSRSVHHDEFDGYSDPADEAYELAKAHGNAHRDRHAS